jgi:hypothetical protein
MSRRDRALMASGLALVVLIAAGVALAPVARRWLIGRFGPPRVEAREAYADAPGGATFDHADFDALLREHVNERGKVDYRGLMRERPRLDAYLARLADADFDGLSRDEKLALLLNAYNAFTLALILDHYPIRSIRDIPEDRRWKAERWRLAGRTVSLDGLEHEWIRPMFADPRVHFALVCGADGCPPLRSYDGAGLDAQLAEQSGRVHGMPDWLRVDPESGAIALSPVYEWYAGDFERADGDVLEHAARHSEALRERLDAGGRPAVRWLDYDWSLNDQAGDESR